MSNTLLESADLAHAHLAAIVASSDDAIVSKDLNGVIQSWNRGAERIFGYSAEEAIGQPITILLPLDRLSDEPRILARLRLGERVDHFETIRRHKDGHLVNISLTVSPIRDRSGRIIGASKIARDITGQMRAQDVLFRTEARFRQLADTMPQIVFSARPDGQVDYYNQRWYEYTGFDHRLGDESWLPLLHPEDRQRTTDTWYRAVRTGEPYQIECRFHDRKTGGHRWHLCRALPVRDETRQIVKWFGTCTDIDDQKQTQEKMVQLNETLFSVLEAIPDIVFVTAPDGRIEFKNPAASRFLQATGLDHLPVAIQAELDRVMQTGEALLPTSFKQVYPFRINQEERFFLSRIVGMKSSGKRIFGAVAMLQDVTEFRLLDEVKTNLIATVSHELKTPITSVRTALLVLLEKTFGPLTPRQSELLVAARDEGERLLRTLNTLLDLARFEESPLGMRLAETAPAELLNAAAQEIQSAADSAGLEVKTQCERGLPSVTVDHEHILHALTNLLTNAIKHSPPGGSILVRARRRKAGICFSVLDQGEGVPEQYQARLFEKFFRVPDAPDPGAGLGLWIARQFVTAHGGRIGLISKPGKGSEFYFILPESAA